MKKETQLFTVLALIFVSSSVFAQFSQSQMVTEWQRAKTYTKAYLDAMPADDYGFKPTPEIRSFAQQMLHLADANYFFTATASGKKMPGQQQEKSVAPNKEAVTKAVMESYDFAIEALESLKPAQLNERVKLEG